MTRTVQRPSLSTWVAEVAKVEHCTSNEYDAGRGFKTYWEFNPDEPNKQCFFEGSGDSTLMVFELRANAVRRDRNPSLLQSFQIPDESPMIPSLRLFDSQMCMEIHKDPRRRRGKVAGERWAIFFRGHNDNEIRCAKKVLRRAELIARAMPDEWFLYRNFFTAPAATAGDIPADRVGDPNIQVGAVQFDLPGGYKVRFTKHLATPAFINELGYSHVRPPRLEGPVTRSRAAVLGSTHMPSNPPAGTGGSRDAIIASRRQKKAEKRAARGKRTESYQLGASAAQPGHSPTVAPTAVSAAYEPSATHSPSPSPQPATAPMAAPEDDLGAASTAASAEAGSEGASSPDPDREWPIKGILDEGVDEDGVTLYQIDWEALLANMEPEDNVSPEAIRVWRQNQRPTRSRRGRRGNRGARRFIW